MYILYNIKYSNQYNIIFSKTMTQNKYHMQLQTQNNICQSILKQGLILQQTGQNRDIFQLLIQKLLEYYIKNTSDDKYNINNFKKKIGKILSKKARVLQIDGQKLKGIKIIIFQIINTKAKNKLHKEILTINININKQNYVNDQQSFQCQFEDNVESKHQYQSVTQTFSKNTLKLTKQQKISQEKQKVAQIEIVEKKKRIYKRKYECYDHIFKQQVYQYATQNGIISTKHKYNLSIRKITNWLRSYKVNILVAGRKALDPAMQFNISVWILKKIWNLIPLTQKIIRQKASTLTTIQNKFNGSKGWLQKYFYRHVQIKKCFDYRNKIQTQLQCAQYHKLAYQKLLKQYSILNKISKNFKIISNNLQEIIYGNKSDTLLKAYQDRYLDRLRNGDQFLYDYQKFKNLQSLPINDNNRAKKEQKYVDYQGLINNNFVENQESQQLLQNQSQQNDVSKKHMKYQQSQDQDYVAMDIFQQDQELEQDKNRNLYEQLLSKQDIFI